MPLNKLWWDKKKKEYTGAPSTGFGELLKKWETDWAKANKEKTLASWESANKAFDKLLKGGETAVDSLRDKKHKGKFDGLGDALNTVLVSAEVKDLRQALLELKGDVGVENQVKVAFNENEGTYLRLWGEWEKLVKLPKSRAQFPLLLEHLKKLTTQAEKCKMEISLAPKYLTQEKLLASLRKSTTEAKEKYEQDLQECLTRRQNLQKQFEELETAQDLGLEKLQQLQTSVGKLLSEKNTPEAVKLAMEAGKLAKGLMEKYKLANDQFAPGTTVRATLDTKKAEIHSDDNVKVLKASYERCIVVNKSNTTKNEQIKNLAEEIGKSVIQTRPRSNDVKN